MSELTVTPTKKRKHAPGANDVSSVSKKSKKAVTKDKLGKKEKEKKKEKGKSKATGHEGEFQDLQASLVVSIPPLFANDSRSGVEEMLDSMVMRYIPAFQGVVLAHASLHFLNKAATINADCPFSTCTVGFNATVWSPRVGMKLVGKVNLCSPDHISLLVHRTFNVSIPRHHIPTDEWEFEYGPAENDPEFGPEAAADEKDNADTDKEHPGGGKWIHRVTAELLGGPEGYLEFTVVGLTVANEMLSLLGSIQFDPFSPEHVPESGLTTKVASEHLTDDEILADERPDDAMDDNDDQDEEYDTFQQLGRMGDEAAAKEAERKAEGAGKKEKKRKASRKGADEAEVRQNGKGNKAKHKRS